MNKINTKKAVGNLRPGSLQRRIAWSYFLHTALFNAFFIGLILLILFITDVEISRKTFIFVCLIEFFIVLVLCAVLSPAVAGKSMIPIRRIIDTAQTINHHNLSARIPLPYHKETELYELTETINQLLDRIEQAVEREKSFTSYASHEFRTPLAILKGTMEVLIRRPRTTEEYKERIETCIMEVDKLNDMVEQLLILTRYEEGRRTLKHKKILVETLVNEGIGPYCDTILEKKMECRIAVSPENAFIYTDENSFLTILKNLISNAVNYANTGGLLEIKGYPQDTEYIVEIINTGKGIPQEELELVFEKFFRSYSSGDSAINGFGLGLPIVKRFCDLLDIKITIESEINDRTTAKLIIPSHELR